MRLFVAVWPTAAVIDELTRLERPDRPGVRWTTRDQWHVTLRFLGEVADVEGADSALELVRSGPVIAVAGPTLQRVGRFVLALPVAGLDDVAAEVGRLTAGVTSGEPSNRPYRGHLTLSRVRPGVDLRPLSSAPLAATWPVEEITLVASRLNRRGARYAVVGRYPLTAGPGTG